MGRRRHPTVANLRRPFSQLPWEGSLLQQDADHAAGVFVDHAAEGLGELLPGVVRHAHDLGGDALGDELIEGLAEDVALPELVGVLLVFAEQIVDQLLGLLLAADMGLISVSICARCMWIDGALARSLTA